MNVASVRIVGVLAAVVTVALASCSSPKHETSSATTATTATTTTEASSTSAPSALPGAPPCQASMAGRNVPPVRPGLIFVGCATSADSLYPITWSSWTSSEAVGSGTHHVNACLLGGSSPPPCAAGKETTYPVTVTLTEPGTLAGMSVFKTITMTPTGSSGRKETVTAAGPYGDWGWSPTS